jgi:hypothetical protein
MSRLFPLTTYQPAYPGAVTLDQITQKLAKVGAPVNQSSAPPSKYPVRFAIGTLAVMVLLAGTGVPLQAATRNHSRTLRVETPEERRELAVENAEALYLQTPGDGSALLYVEEQGGRALIVLDVTDPARIRRIADAPLAAGSDFDFVRTVSQKAVLVRYRDGSGFAILNLKHRRHPILATALAFPQTENSEQLDEANVLVMAGETANQPLRDPQTYRLVDTSDVTTPRELATISDVTQRVENQETGTLFLLNKNGVTMIRRLRIEQDHQVELIQDNGN